MNEKEITVVANWGRWVGGSLFVLWLFIVFDVWPMWTFYLFKKTKLKTKSAGGEGDLETDFTHTLVSWQPNLSKFSTPFFQSLSQWWQLQKVRAGEKGRAEGREIGPVLTVHAALPLTLLSNEIVHETLYWRVGDVFAKGTFCNPALSLLHIYKSAISLK